PSNPRHLSTPPPIFRSALPSAGIVTANHPPACATSGEIRSLIPSTVAPSPPTSASPLMSLPAATTPLQPFAATRKTTPTFTSSPIAASYQRQRRPHPRLHLHDQNRLADTHPAIHHLDPQQGLRG